MLGIVHSVRRESEGQKACYDPYFEPFGYLGPVGTGLPNLTLAQKPPVKPQPEDEQGIGRAPGMKWESREHPIYDNPDYYLDAPMTFPEPCEGAEFAPVHGTPGMDRVGAIMALDFYQQHQEGTYPGMVYQDTTVPALPAVPNSQVSRL